MQHRQVVKAAGIAWMILSQHTAAYLQCLSEKRLRF
jgi:hypothetical protein